MAAYTERKNPIEVPSGYGGRRLACSDVGCQLSILTYAQTDDAKIKAEDGAGVHVIGHGDRFTPGAIFRGDAGHTIPQTAFERFVSVVILLINLDDNADLAFRPSPGRCAQTFQSGLKRSPPIAVNFSQTGCTHQCGIEQGAFTLAQQTYCVDSNRKCPRWDLVATSYAFGEFFELRLSLDTFRACNSLEHSRFLCGFGYLLDLMWAQNLGLIVSSTFATQLRFLPH